MAKYRIVYQNTSIEAPDGAFLVGRSAECHLVLDDPSVSRVHFAIILEDSKLYVEDKGSRNGVRVNGLRADGRQTLRDGDRITVGHQTVRILSTERVADADRTIGLGVCETCGAWVASHEKTCSRCGARREPAAPVVKKSKNESIVVEHQPISMVASLSLKSIRVGKLDEAERLLGNAIASTTSKLEHGTELSENEIKAITDAFVAMAKAAKSAPHITRLFGFFLLIGQLMPRELVEKLYEIVRAVDYFACAEMTRYIEFLNTHADTFSPGERFVHRRLQGLYKICS